QPGQGGVARRGPQLGTYLCRGRLLGRSGGSDARRAVGRLRACRARRCQHWRGKGRGACADDRRRGQLPGRPGPRVEQRDCLGMRFDRGLRGRKQRLLDVTLALSTDQKTEALLEALPYICEYVGKTVVIKVGGSVGEEGTVLDDVVWLKRLGINPVL